MAASGANSEPSMDEILASIRRIVEEEKASPPPAAPVPARTQSDTRELTLENGPTASPLKDRLKTYEDAGRAAGATAGGMDPSVQPAGPASNPSAGSPSADVPSPGPHADPKSLRTAIDRDFSDLFAAGEPASRPRDPSAPVGKSAEPGFGEAAGGDTDNSAAARAEGSFSRNTAPPFGLQRSTNDPETETGQPTPAAGSKEASQDPAGETQLTGSETAAEEDAPSPMDFSAIVPARESLFEQTARSSQPETGPDTDDQFGETATAGGQAGASSGAPSPGGQTAPSGTQLFASPTAEDTAADDTAEDAASNGGLSVGVSLADGTPTASGEPPQAGPAAAAAEPARSPLPGLAGLPAGARVIAAMPDKISAPERQPASETASENDQPEPQAAADAAAANTQPVAGNAGVDPLTTRPDPRQVRPGSALESLLASGVGSGLPSAAAPVEPATDDPAPARDTLPAMEVTPFGPSDLDAMDEPAVDSTADMSADTPDQTMPAEATPEPVASEDSPGRTAAAATTSRETTQDALERTLDETAAELLRPMVREWLDRNMPRIFEKALQIEMAESVKRQLANKDQAGES